MLEITANGEKMQLPADIEINMTFENPLFLVDRIPATYSMSFDMPATAGNLKLAGNPDRIAAAGNWTAFDSSIIFKGVVISKGRLKLEEVEKRLKFAYVGSLLPAYVKKSMNLLNIGLYDFGSEGPVLGQHDYSAGWSLNYKEAVFNGNADIGNEFAACPIRITEAEWKDMLGAYNMKNMYLNGWNVQAGNYLFQEAVLPSHTIHGCVFPQPYIHHLIDLVMGAALNTNFLKDEAELKKVCMVTTAHPNFSEDNMLLYNQRGATLDYYYAFKLSSFFNKYAFNDFLRDILKIFCCSLMPRPDGTWDLLHNKTILEDTGIDDWSGKLAGTPVVGLQKAQKYGYGYSSESASDDKTAYSSIASIEVLMAGTTLKGTYKITSTGEIYEKRLKDENVPDVYVYERKYSGLGTSSALSDQEDSDTFDVTSDVAPVTMRPDEWWYQDGNPTKYPWYVPEFSGDRYKIDQAPQIGFARGFYNRETQQIDDPVGDYSNHYPLLSPFNHDPAGNKIGDYSLAWEGADGLKNKFHKDFIDYLARDRQTLKADMRLTNLDLKNLDYKRKKYIWGRLFYLVKLETTFRKNSISLCRCEFVES
jgi:hypothetical protein